jgi:glycerophosphoryl diester phosphodiesterase
MGKPPPLAPLVRLVPHLGRLGRGTRWRRTKGRPRVWAHRGDSAHEPENTMPAFERARAVGTDGIELDVRLDRDGTVVVFHDDTLDRLCGRAGRIEELAGAERRLLRVGGQPIPTLAEVLHAFADLEINVEIKAPKLLRAHALVSATAKVIADSGHADQIIVSSFDPSALVQLHMILPDVSTAYLFHDAQALPIRKGWLGRLTGASVFHPNHALCTERSVRHWHQAGLPLNVWTVDDPVELARLAALGVDGVFTNDPAGALAVLDRRA